MTTDALTEARRHSRAFAASRRIAAASDLATAATQAADCLTDLIDADRAQLWFYDASSGELWTTERDGGAAEVPDGVIAACARTATPVQLARAGDDPRWDRARTGDAARARLQAVPVGPAGAVDAVLVAWRSEARAPFAADELASAVALAALIAPLLPQLAAHGEAQEVIAAAADDALFRREALEAQRADAWGELVAGSPRWLRWVHLGLVVTMAAALAFVVIARVHTYARGPAVIRQTARTEVAARVAGNVARTHLTPGARVVAGDPLVALDDAPQAAEVERLAAAFAARLRERMLAPSVAALGEGVAAARLELARARAALDERIMRATRDGIVGDIRVRVGQRVEPGEVVASVVDPASPVEVIALVPSGARPRLRVGQRLRLELAGFPRSAQDVTVAAIAAEAIGPDEARRYLGSASAPVAGPVVVVRALLPAGFRSDGQTFRYVDGMAATAAIEVGSERIIHALIPGLGGAP